MPRFLRILAGRLHLLVTSGVPLSRLERLNDKILTLIMENLQLTFEFDSHYIGKPEIRNRNDLWSLSLSSRRLNKIATPVLFRTFIQTKNHALPAFIKQLLSKSELGYYVKRIFCTSQNRVSENFSMDAHGFTSMDYEVCFELLKNRSGLNNFDGMRDIKSGSWGALLALLLCLVPSLEEITLFDHGRPTSFWLRDILDRAARDQAENNNSSFSLSHLKRVTFHYARDGLSSQFCQIAPFLCLKSVEIFHVTKMDILNDVESWSFSVGEQRYVNTEPTIIPRDCVFQTKHIRLDHCRIRHNRFREFFKCFRSLQSLEYIYGGQDGCGSGRFNGSEFGLAISHLKPSLEYLRITSCSELQVKKLDRHGDLVPSHWLLGPCLSDFEKLVELYIDRAVFSASADAQRDDEAEVSYEETNLFPKCLEKLTVSRGLIEPRQIAYLVKQRGELVPSLKVLKICMRRVAPYKRERLLDAYKAAGIDLLFFK